jgi:hypothetical protein
VESSLLEAGMIDHHLFFSVEDIDSVRLFGVVSSPEEKGNVERRLRKIKEIKNLRNELAIVPGSIGGV